MLLCPSYTQNPMKDVPIESFETLLVADHSNITKTCLYNFNPLKPQFYIVKLRFKGVYIIFLISAQKHRLWVLVRTASQRPTIYVLSRNITNIRIFYLKFSFFLVVKFSVYLNMRIFVIIIKSMHGCSFYSAPPFSYMPSTKAAQAVS